MTNFAEKINSKVIAANNYNQENNSGPGLKNLNEEIMSDYSNIL